MKYKVYCIRAMQQMNDSTQYTFSVMGDVPTIVLNIEVEPSAKCQPEFKVGKAYTMTLEEAGVE